MSLFEERSSSKSNNYSLATLGFSLAVSTFDVTILLSP